MLRILCKLQENLVMVKRLSLVMEKLKLFKEDHLFMAIKVVIEHLNILVMNNKLKLKLLIKKNKLKLELLVKKNMNVIFNKVVELLMIVLIIIKLKIIVNMVINIKVVMIVILIKLLIKQLLIINNKMVNILKMNIILKLI